MELQKLCLDASTLILLAKTDLLPLVAAQTGVVMTEVVKEEVMAKPSSYDAQLIGRMLRERKVLVHASPSRAACETVREQFRLEAGEASSLVLAKGQGWPVGTDDGRAIRAAKLLGISFTTTLQLLGALHARSLVSTRSALAKLEALEGWGRYHPRLLEDVRSRITSGGGTT